MRFLVLFALVWCCNAQVVVLPYSWAQHYRGQDIFGQSTFGHVQLDQNRFETRLADGRVIGQYSYIDSEGKPALTTYEAGPNTGFRVTGSNILPEAPSADLAAPLPVEDTPEVAAAKADFQKKFDEAAARPSEPANRKKRQAIIPYSFFPSFTQAKVETKASESDVPNLVTLPYTTSPFYYTLPQTKIVTATDDGEKPLVSLPYASPFFPTTSTFVHPGFPFVTVNPKAEEPAKVERARRSLPLALPYAAVPTTTVHKFETKQFEPVDAATPADTSKLELTTKSHELKVPGYQFINPLVQVAPKAGVVPTTYTASYPFNTAYPYGVFPYNFPFVTTAEAEE